MTEDPGPGGTTNAVPVQRHAFIDESYSPRDQPSPAYVMSAVIVVGDPVVLRRELRALIAPATSFHATELARDGDVDLLIEVLDWIVAKGYVSLVVAQMPYAYTEEAREACLRQLVRELCARGVSQAVLDSRRHPFGSDPGAADRADAKVIADLTRAGQIPRGFTARHFSDSAEPLLWLADAVAWIARRHLTAADARWATHMGHVQVIRIPGVRRRP
jgi:hypothetical protein